jgi:hypothetical protein
LKVINDVNAPARTSFAYQKQKKTKHKIENKCKKTKQKNKQTKTNKNNFKKKKKTKYKKHAIFCSKLYPFPVCHNCRTAKHMPVFATFGA